MASNAPNATDAGRSAPQTDDPPGPGSVMAATQRLMAETRARLLLLESGKTKPNAVYILTKLRGKSVAKSPELMAVSLAFLSWKSQIEQNHIAVIVKDDAVRVVDLNVDDLDDDDEANIFAEFSECTRRGKCICADLAASGCPDHCTCAPL